MKVHIKELDWNKDNIWAYAKTEVGIYKLSAYTNGKYCMDLIGEGKAENLCFMKTEKEARKAAQKDFEKRVKSCLEKE